MTDTRKASLTLFASTNADGPDGIRMEVDFDGEFDPQHTVDNIINHFANQLIEQSARAAHAELQEKKEAEDKPRILTLGGVR